MLALPMSNGDRCFWKLRGPSLSINICADCPAAASKKREGSRFDNTVTTDGVACPRLPGYL